MARHGDLYENTVTGERAVVLRGDEAPELPLLAHLTVRPGGFVAGEHVHPALTERFKVIAGELRTRIDGVEAPLRAGEEATVPPGVRHDWWNASAEDVHVLVELSGPGVARFEQAIATGFGLANSGRTDAKGRPNLLQAALMAQEFADVLVFTKPPVRGPARALRRARPDRPPARLQGDLPRAARLRTGASRPTRARWPPQGSVQWSNRSPVRWAAGCRSEPTTRARAARWRARWRSSASAGRC